MAGTGTASYLAALEAEVAGLFDTGKPEDPTFSFEMIQWHGLLLSLEQLDQFVPATMCAYIYIYRPMVGWFMCLA